MKYFLISIMIFLFSCSSELKNTEVIEEVIKPNPLGLCDNEVELLKSDSKEEIVFDFGQCMGPIKDSTGCNIFNFIEMQTPIDLCDNELNFSTLFEIGNGDTLVCNLYALKFCEVIYCGRPMIENVLINSNHQVLVEGMYVRGDDSLKYDIAKILREDIKVYNPLRNGRLYYAIHWDDNVEVSFKKFVFKSIIEAYFIEANHLSREYFNKDICSLNSFQIDSFKNVFKFNVLLEEMVLVEKPLLPPTIIKDTLKIELIQDTI